MYPQDRVPARAIVLSLKPDASRIWLNADGEVRHEFSDAPIGTSRAARQRRHHIGSFERFPDGTLVWSKNGVCHRDGGPAVIWSNGDREWWRNGLRHRSHGPAMQAADGRLQVWLRNGLHHREVGPAILYPDGSEEWFHNGLRHRQDGPAINYRGERMEWYRHGTLHREDGPAILWRDGREEWCLNGRPHLEFGPTSARPGTKMADGTIYAGASPSDGKALYTMPEDAPLVGGLQAAQQHASSLDAHGHKDWRVPTKAELNLLFDNRAAIGAFNITGSLPDGWYWSSTSAAESFAWGRCFSDGFEMSFAVFSSLSVRLVR
jgi:hypothetical protein